MLRNVHIARGKFLESGQGILVPVAPNVGNGELVGELKLVGLGLVQVICDSSGSGLSFLSQIAGNLSEGVDHLELGSWGLSECSTEGLLVLEDQVDQDTDLDLLGISNISSRFSGRQSLKFRRDALLAGLAEEAVDFSFQVDEDLEANGDLLGQVELVLQSVAHELVVLQLGLQLRQLGRACSGDQSVDSRSLNYVVFELRSELGGLSTLALEVLVVQVGMRGTGLHETLDLVFNALLLGGGGRF